MLAKTSALEGIVCLFQPRSPGARGPQKKSGGYHLKESTSCGSRTHYDFFIMAQ
jgi:hypothetical protein